MVYVTVSAVQRARYGYGALCLIISAQVATDVIYQYASSISRCEHQCCMYTWVTLSARARNEDTCQMVNWSSAREYRQWRMVL